ncbi:MAG: ATP-binding cassette domain-containing protein [Bryobacteraceae bacterium]|nr:ATP-binding cassette domain-containing protein [Bryobacteraceae bacterium]
MAHSDSSGLEVHGLSVWYQGVIRAVEDVSLDVASGTTCGILGLNGAGKTTLLRALSGFLRAERVKVSAEAIMLGGTSLAGLSPGRAADRGVVIVAERDKVFANLTIDENLQIAARRIRGSKAQRQKVFDEAIERFPILQTRRRQQAGLLSGGERQMLALAAAFMAQPKLLLLDEPSLGLAPSVLLEVEKAIQLIVSRGNVTCLVADQNAALVTNVASTVHLLQRGRLSAPLDRSTLKDADIAAALLGSHKQESISQ